MHPWRRCRVNKTTRSGPSSSRICNALSRSPRPEDLLGFVNVVRPAAKLQVLHRARAAGGKRLQVMHFEKPTFRTSALRTDERAAAFVAGPDLPTDCRGDPSGSRSNTARRTRMADGRHARALELLYQQPQGARENRSRIAGRHHVTQEVLGTTQVFVRLSRNSDVHPVVFGRQRGHRYARAIPIGTRHPRIVHRIRIRVAGC